MSHSIHDQVPGTALRKLPCQVTPAQYNQLAHAMNDYMLGTVPTAWDPATGHVYLRVAAGRPAKADQTTDDQGNCYCDDEAEYEFFAGFITGFMAHITRGEIYEADAANDPNPYV